MQRKGIHDNLFVITLLQSSAVCAILLLLLLQKTLRLYKYTWLVTLV